MNHITYISLKGLKSVQVGKVLKEVLRQGHVSNIRTHRYKKDLIDINIRILNIDDHLRMGEKVSKVCGKLEMRTVTEDTFYHCGHFLVEVLVFESGAHVKSEQCHPHLKERMK